MYLENGGWSAKIIADSVSPMGKRLTTMEVVFPRIVLAEFNTHRLFSRNSASSRAIPIEKMIKMVKDNPFVPTYWGANQKGMQADFELDPVQVESSARPVWHAAITAAVTHAELLMKAGVHKQIANRLLEPFMWHRVIVTATEWTNFFYLRCSKNAQPEIRNVALLMRELYEKNEPTALRYDQWHLPYIQEAEYDLQLDLKKKLSTARCARVSYLTHDGERDLGLDLNLYDTLLSNRHMSPFEHQATPSQYARWSGNFKGWYQHRKMIPNEFDASELQEREG